MKNLFLILLTFSLGCTSIEQHPLNKALSSQNPKIKRVMDRLEQHQVQILFTQVIRHKNKPVQFKDFEFQVDDSLYFYPASTVKFPIAVLTLEKIFDATPYNRNTKFYVEGDSLETTFANEVEKIFAVSDNEAFNRLFEFLGQDEINRRLKSKGLNARISHRLSTLNSGDITTKPMVFYLNDSTTTSSIEIINQPLESLQLKNIKKGLGYIEGDSLIHNAKDFSLKNYLPLRSLHSMMKRLFFPELYTKDKGFNLAADDHDFLIQSMKILPSEAGYKSEEYYDSYGKFFIYGDTKAAMPRDIEIFNKVGYAYGTLTDCAYIIDTRHAKEYILSATILVNENGIFNDDQYEYENVGIPFLAELGRELIKR